MKRALLILSLFLLALASVASAEDDIVLKAMRDELSRSMANLKLEKLEKPYFIAYRVDELDTATVSATLGELTGSTTNRYRYFSSQLRVGDYALDNTNFMGAKAFSRGGTYLPIDDDYNEIRRDIWLATDAQYKAATSDLSAKRSILQKRQGDSELPDFIKGTPTTLLQPRTTLKADVPAMEKLAREMSAAFVGSPEIVSSGVNIYVGNTYVRFVNGEGTTFTRPEPGVIVSVGAQTLAADGTPLDDSFQVYGTSLDVLSSETLVTRTRELVTRLKALRTAPLIERYNGPVLFEDEGAAEAFSQVFAPAVVAGRFPVSEEPQFETQMQQVLDQFGASLADRIGARVLPESFDVVDDPKPTSYEGVALMGTNEIDDEGVPTQKTKLVEGGILQTLLSTRTPTRQTSTSTGSASTGGATPTTLFVTTKNGKSIDELRQQLLTIAKKRGYDYGIIVRRSGSTGLSGIVRMAARTMSANGGGSLAVYKRYADGHEELARADMSPLTLANFKDILAAGNKPYVYNGAFMHLIGSLVGGGRGGASIISYIVPPLLFEEMTLKKPTGPTPKPPIVASPLMSPMPGSTAVGK